MTGPSTPALAAAPLALPLLDPGVLEISATAPPRQLAPPPGTACWPANLLGLACRWRRPEPPPALRAPPPAPTPSIHLGRVARTWPAPNGVDHDPAAGSRPRPAPVDLYAAAGWITGRSPLKVRGRASHFPPRRCELSTATRFSVNDIYHPWLRSKRLTSASNAEKDGSTRSVAKSSISAASRCLAGPRRILLRLRLPSPLASFRSDSSVALGSGNPSSARTAGRESRTAPDGFPAASRMAAPL